MEKYTMVKTEVQENGDIFLYYVDDESGSQEDEGVVMIDQSQYQQLQEDYIIQEVPVQQELIQAVQSDETDQSTTLDQCQNRWSDEEIRKLIIFYVDNEEAFQIKTTKKHVWSYACKTMLTQKNPASCEAKLLSMKKKYALAFLDYHKHKVESNWPYYELCHEAFQKDEFVKTILKDNGINDKKQTINLPVTKPEEDSAVPLKRVKKAPDEGISQMLDLYLQYKKESGKDNSWQKHIWEKIAIQLGFDGEYWHKRFLNFKQHYIRLLEKRNETNLHSIAWPYMSVFDEIFKDDTNFQHKYGGEVGNVEVIIDNPKEIPVSDWDVTEKTVLIKYCFDSYDEFQDPTIPNTFLWNEVGRLLDKKGDSCKEKYEELRTEHLNLYLAGGYTIAKRIPIAILFDTLISKEIEQKLSAYLIKSVGTDIEWETEKFDQMVEFFYDNVELFKDPICHFVCMAAIAFKLSETVETCRGQWDQLSQLYKSILNDKKEDPELQIDWRYIELFDRIFDYGMDMKLLDGYEKPIQKKDPVPIVKKQTKLEDMLKTLSDYEDMDEKSTGKRTRGTEDPKAVKILEYYYKNKEKFSTSQRKKHALWEVLAQQLGVTAEQCAHRLRNLKQIYTAYVQKEINKPDMPVLWPYYVLCKKVFGYRAIKNKLRNGKLDSEDAEEWSTREIKMIINYVAKNFDELNSNTEDPSKWIGLSKDINKSPTSCLEKFLDLRRSYRKVKSMKTKNPDCKVNWKFYKLFDNIYSKDEVVDVESSDEAVLSDSAIKAANQDDDDFQCIIVLPEDEDITVADNVRIDVDNARIVIKQPQDSTDTPIEPKTKRKIVWKRIHKTKLLTYYYEHILANKGKVIDVKEMWKEIASHFRNRSPRSCRALFMRLKNKYKEKKLANKLNTDNKLNILMKQILTEKPKFVRPPFTYDEIELKEQSTYTDIDVPLWKVQTALKYYLDHVEDFVNPKYDQKYVWIELAKHASVPAIKIFKKINYLKQFYNSETNEVKGVKVEFGDILKEILEKEFICRIAIGSVPEPIQSDDEVNWSEEETEQLLLWYLENLDYFKNPKYLPSYLWLEASTVLNKSAVACSKKMNDIRSQYSAMMKESPDPLNKPIWRFYDLCQKIYGTGKKSATDE